MDTLTKPLTFIVASSLAESQEQFIADILAGRERPLAPDGILQWWEIDAAGRPQLIVAVDTPANRARMERWTALLPEWNGPLTAEERREILRGIFP